MNKTIVLTIEKGKRFDPSAAAGSLFDEPVSSRVNTENPDYGSLFDLHFQNHAAPITHVPKPVSAPKVIKPPKPKHFAAKNTFSLFDDESHPRAGEGQEHYNPETGKTSRGGQFAHNPNKVENDEPTNDTRPGVEGQEAESGGATLVEPALPVSTENVHGSDDKERTGGGSTGTTEPSYRDGHVPVSEKTSADTDSGGDGGEGISAGAVDGGLSGLNQSGVGSLSQGNPLVPDPFTGDAAPIPDELEDFSAQMLSGLRAVSTGKKIGYDYRITDEDHIGETGNKQKAEDNLAAIALLNDLRENNRMATPEEQGVLAKYSGWGWAQRIFHQDNIRAYEGLNSRYTINSSSINYYRSLKNEKYEDFVELKKLLTPDAFKQAQISLNNAHYTDVPVVRAMWQAVRHLGFKGGRVLEPAVGAGNFFGCMPADIAANSIMSGVDLDGTSAEIAHQLYQNAQIVHSGFEDADKQIADGFYDLAISNVPFGDFGVFDKVFNTTGRKDLSRYIHNYFFNKAIQKVKPGGLIAFITGTGTMDSDAAKTTRENLNNQADFLGSVRLPSDAFKKNAGTEVTTDIIFLRKRKPGEEPNGKDWVASSRVKVEGEFVNLNTYYQDHPEFMLGEAVLGKMQHSPRIAVKSTGGNIEEKITAALQSLPRDVVNTITSPDEINADADAYLPDEGDTQINGWMYDPRLDKIMILRKGTGLEDTEIDTKSKKGKKIIEMLKVRDLFRTLTKSSYSDSATDESIERQQSLLSTAYDGFVKKFGTFNDKQNFSDLHYDPEFSRLLALETYNPDTETTTKSRLFTERPRYMSNIVTAGNCNEAMMISLSETNRLDFDRMASLTGKSPVDVIHELAAAKHIYKNPCGDWERADDYLTGNVREKLKTARAAALADPQYAGNVEALEDAQPPEMTPGQIPITLGAPWIPINYIDEFTDHIFGTSNMGQDIDKAHHRWGYAAADGSWYPTQEIHHTYRANNATFQSYGSDEMPAHKILEKLLNGETIQVRRDDQLDPEATAAAKAAAARISQEFQDWIWSDENRAKDLVETYNDKRGGMVKRHFDGQHLTLPGLSPFGQDNLNPRVKDSIYRVCQTPNVGGFQCVGFGKTWLGAGSVMELRRLGLRKKPMIAVPNHLVGQWGKEIAEIYPSAKIMLIDPKDMDRNKRHEMLARIATGDYDAIIIPHSTFDRLPLSVETQRKYIQSQLDEIDHAIDASDVDAPTPTSPSYARRVAKKKDPTTKRLNSAKQKLETKLRTLMARAANNHDNFMTFEELGVDHLVVDEFHNYKNLFFVTRRGQTRGVPNSDSQKAMSMMMKVRHVQDKNGGGGLLALTGTPVSNSIAELWVMQHYLDPQSQKKLGTYSFDAWAQEHGETRNEIEATVSGTWKSTERFSKFVGVPALSMQLSQYADVVRPDEMTANVPKHIRTTIKCPANQWQKDYLDSLADRGEILSGNGGVPRPDPREDNFLKLTSDGKMNTLDPRLIDPTAPEGSRLNLVADQMAKHYHDPAVLDASGKRINAFQVGFLDLGTPKTLSTNKGEDEEATTNDDEFAEEYKSYANEQVSPSHKNWANELAEFHANGQQTDEPQNPAFRDMSKVSPEDLELFNTFSEKLTNGLSQEYLDDLLKDASPVVKDAVVYHAIQKDVEAIAAEHSKAKQLRDSLYHDLRRKLIERGIPAEEIGFMHDYAKDADKRKMMASANNGNFRILLGSTLKMGTGMNAQKRMIALHHLDCPWKPSDVEQREGRIIRQGNMNKDVHIYNYVTEGINGMPSFDSVLWNTQERKASSTNHLLKGDPNTQSVEDMGDTVINAAHLKAIASGNPAIFEKFELETKINQLSVAYRAHRDRMYSIKQKLVSIPREIVESQKIIEHNQKFVDLNKDVTEKPVISVGGKAWPKMEDGLHAIGMRLHGFMHDNIGGNSKGQLIGKYGPFPLIITKGPNGDMGVAVTTDAGGALKGDPDVPVVYMGSPTETIKYHLSRFVGRIDGLESGMKEHIKKLTEELKKYEGQTSEYEGKAELDAAEKRLTQVDAELEGMQRAGRNRIAGVK